MSSLDGYELPDLATRSPIENYAGLVGLIETAYTSGVLTPLPAVKGEEVEEPLVGARVSALRTWLHLLGYLRSDSGEATVDDGLRRALQRFQGEAGLKDDGWVDEETWTALEELVSFEKPANVLRWVSGSEPSRPLLRAVGLRLTAFGLLDRPTRNQRQVRQGLRDFVRVANALRLAETRLEAGYSQATLTVLFDQDGLVQRLAHFEGAFNFSPPGDRPEEAAWELVEHFVACCARIELWLLGYEIDLAGSASLAGKEWRFVVPPLEGQPGAWRKAEYAAMQVRRLAQEVRQQAVYFGAGCCLLAALLRAVVAAVQGLALPGAGWFAFILALVKVYREARLLVVEGT